MEGTNLLKGLRCPHCGSQGPFLIEGSAVFLVHDDGCTEFEDLSWEDDSFIRCPQCGEDGDILRFDSVVQDAASGDAP